LRPDGRGKIVTIARKPAYEFFFPF
jgi:hypothetical protein